MSTTSEVFSLASTPELEMRRRINALLIPTADDISCVLTQTICAIQSEPAKVFLRAFPNGDDIVSRRQLRELYERISSRTKFSSACTNVLSQLPRHGFQLENNAKGRADDDTLYCLRRCHPSVAVVNTETDGILRAHANVLEYAQKLPPREGHLFTGLCGRSAGAWEHQLAEACGMDIGWVRSILDACNNPRDKGFRTDRHRGLVLIRQYYCMTYIVDNEKTRAEIMRPLQRFDDGGIVDSCGRREGDVDATCGADATVAAGGVDEDDGDGGTKDAEPATDCATKRLTVMAEKIRELEEMLEAARVEVEALRAERAGMLETIERFSKEPKSCDTERAPARCAEKLTAEQQRHVDIAFGQLFACQNVGQLRGIVSKVLDELAGATRNNGSQTIPTHVLAALRDGIHTATRESGRASGRITTPALINIANVFSRALSQCRSEKDISARTFLLLRVHDYNVK